MYLIFLTDSEHEPLQLVRLGTISLHDCSDPHKGRKAQDKDDRTDHQAYGEGDGDEVEEALRVPEPQEANSRQYVPFNLLQDDHYAGEDGGHGPSDCVEPLALDVD